jgi:hypothetical protein
MKQILVTCDPENRLLRIPLDELNVLQGKLKEMSVENYEKFRKIILEDGINFALHVWKELDGTKKKPCVKWWLIDGTGRKHLLTKLRDMDGYDIPPLPCVEIHAVNYEAAKKQVLSASSSFHRTTHQGLYEFIEDLALPVAELEKYDLPSINLPKFKAEFYEEPEPAEGATELDKGTFTKFSQQCPKCGFSFDSKDNDEAS